jgi:hypothetical protein
MGGAGGEKRLHRSFLAASRACKAARGETLENLFSRDEFLEAVFLNYKRDFGHAFTEKNLCVLCRQQCLFPRVCFPNITFARAFCSLKS